MENLILNEFRKKYTYINQETMAISARENPEILIQLMDSSPLNNYTKACILLALGEVEDSTHFDYILPFTKNDCPLIRESAFMSLTGFFTDDKIGFEKIKFILEEGLRVETQPGVIKQINNLLGWIVFWKG